MCLFIISKEIIVFIFNVFGRPLNYIIFLNIKRVMFARLICVYFSGVLVYVLIHIEVMLLEVLITAKNVPFSIGKIGIH